MADVRQIVIDIISDIAPDEDVTNLDDKKSLREQLDLDSMDFLDIVMELRKRHKIEVPQEDYPQLASLESCVAYLGPKFAAANA
jgi:acyl carrier protein